MKLVIYSIQHKVKRWQKTTQKYFMDIESGLIQPSLSPLSICEAPECVGMGLWKIYFHWHSSQIS